MLEKFDSYAADFRLRLHRGSGCLPSEPTMEQWTANRSPTASGRWDFCFWPIRSARPRRRPLPTFAKQGVEVKVISGDNPVTVSNVAREAGIDHAEAYVDASQLRSDEELREAVLHNTVFGRVTPDQKRKFVRALKEAGHTVAMTGDGGNDVLALKDADCSIAMASGSDAAAQLPSWCCWSRISPACLRWCWRDGGW